MLCAGVAVLEAIDQDKLQQNAHDVGSYLTHALQALQKVCQESCRLISAMSLCLYFADFYISTYKYCHAQTAWPCMIVHG